MTTQNTSPFQSTTENKTTDTPQNFSFQTMQEDLLNLEKSRISELKPKIEESSTNKSTPIVQEKKPFDQKQVSPREVPPFSFLQTKKPETKNLQSTEKQAIPKKKSNKAINLVYFFIILLTVCLVLLGFYYFWITRDTDQQVVIEKSSTQQTEEPITEKPTPIIEAPTEKYSQENPNYLTLDLTNKSITEIQSAIIAVSGELKEKSAQTPYEFILVDNNNDPIAFSAFAKATSLIISSTVLGSLGENFSLFIYNDNEKTRIGVSIEIAKPEKIANEIQKQEKTLVKDLSSIFLNEKLETTTGIFTMTEYNGKTIRYINLNKEGDLSVDYSIVDSYLIISTSKRTQWAILDKLLKQSNPTIQQQATTESEDPLPAQDKTETQIQNNISQQ